MKKAKIILAAALALLLLAACGKQSPQYVNLTDDATRQEVAEALLAHGVSQPQVDTLLTWSADFNAAVPAGTLPEGFAALPENGADYSGVFLDDAAATYDYLQWLNCRLTAFQLVKDHLHTAGNGNDLDIWLMFDMEAIDTLPQYQLTEEERANFVTLFNQVDVSGASSVEEHEEKIQAAWQQRDIQLTGDGLSLICVYLHAPEDQVRFVGHTGVLLETAQELLFVEKWGPAAPFQVTRFPDRAALKQYLLARPDLYGDETELPPIVTENGAALA